MKQKGNKEIDKILKKVPTGVQQLSFKNSVNSLMYSGKLFGAMFSDIDTARLFQCDRNKVLCTKLWACFLL